MVEALLYLPMNICKVLLYPMDPPEDTWIHGDKTHHFGSFWLISNRNAVASAHVLRRLEGRFQAALLDMSGQLITGCISAWLDNV